MFIIEQLTVDQLFNIPPTKSKQIKASDVPDKFHCFVKINCLHRHSSETFVSKIRYCCDIPDERAYLILPFVYVVEIYSLVTLICTCYVLITFESP